MTKNGDSIYTTRGGPWRSTKEIASTRKGNTIFVHVLKSTDGKIHLPNIPAKITAATLMDGSAIEFTQGDTGISLTIPAASLQPIDTVIKLQIDKPAMDLAPVTITP